MNRGERQHLERRAWQRRTERTPGYVGKHAGKTSGKACSAPRCCGNPRRYDGEPTLQEQRVFADDGGASDYDSAAATAERELAACEADPSTCPICRPS